MPRTTKHKKENDKPKGPQALQPPQAPKRTQPNGRPIFDEKYNLKNRTPEERKRIATAGGKASGEVRREKRDLRKIMRQILDTEVVNKEGKPEEVRYTMALAVARRAMKGDIFAFKTCGEYAGEAPAERHEITGADGTALTPPQINILPVAVHAVNADNTEKPKK